MTTRVLYRPAGDRPPSSDGILGLFPGTGTPPGHYDHLLRALEHELGVEAVVCCPAGIGPRKHATSPIGPSALAAEALEAVRDCTGPRIWFGHSWGGHAARAAALGDRRASALVLIDPNLGSTTPPDPLQFDPPDRIADRATAVALYAEHGIPEDHIVWLSWKTSDDGSLRPVYVAAIVRAHIAATPWGSVVTDEVRRATDRIPVAVVRTAALTINPPKAWDQLRHLAPRARKLEAIGVHHVLPAKEQAAVAAVIIAWIREVGIVRAGRSAPHRRASISSAEYDTVNVRRHKTSTFALRGQK